MLFFFRIIRITGLAGILFFAYTQLFLQDFSVLCIYLGLNAIFYLLCKRYVRRYYLTRKFFNFELQALVFYFSLLLIAHIAYVFLIMFNLLDFSLIQVVLMGMVIFLIFLPFFTAEVLIWFYKAHLLSQAKLKFIKKLWPHHRYFRFAWNNSTQSHLSAFLISIEPDALSFDGFLHEIMMQWLHTRIISPLSFINKKQRGEYKFLFATTNNETQPEIPPILEIENFASSATEIKLTVQTSGNLILDDLISGKSRAKMHELFAHKNLLLRALSVDKHKHLIHFQFYDLNKAGFSREVIEIIYRLEMAFTELNVMNAYNHYPFLDKIDVLDQDTKTNLIYTIKATYKLPNGLSAEQFSKNKITEIAAYVRRPFYQHRLKPHQDQIEFFIEISPRPLDKLKYSDFPPAEGLRVPIGFDLKWRKPVFMNLNQAGIRENDPGYTPHVLIAGATGSGKSCFIRYLILQFLRGHTPDSLRLFLVDPKIVSFSIFKKIPYLYAPIVSDAKKFQMVLNGILEEVDQRYEILAKHNVEHLSFLEKVAPEEAKKIPRLLLIIDEFADIFDKHDFKTQEQISLFLKRLGQKSRAAGVHIILITQRATSANINSEIKANISGRIAFKVASEGDSEIIIESPDAANIERRGEGYAKLGDTEELTHFQSPYVSEEDFFFEFQELTKYDFRYWNEALSAELQKEPLRIEDVTPKFLPLPKFPDIPVGVNLKTHAINFLRFEKSDFKTEIEPTPHLIVAGATNTGKSKFAKVILSQLVRAGGPDLIKIILVDPKQVTFRKFLNIPQLDCPIITKHHLLLPVLEDLLKKIEERYKLFAAHNCENIEEFRKKTGKKIPSYFLFIDEFADLLDFYSFKDRERIEKILKRYGQMARAAGIHLIILTQRANSQNFPSEIRANFSGRISFRVNSEADSFYILEQPGADKIEHAGVYRIKANDQPVFEAYAPLFHGPDFEDIVKAAQDKWGEPQFSEIAQIVMKEPLDSEAVAVDFLPKSVFPYIPIGVNLATHEIISLCFENDPANQKEDPTPHLIVAGGTNSGKSVFAKLLVFKLIRSISPDLVRLILVDPKKVTFQKFAQDPHLALPILTEHRLMLPMLKKVLKIIEERYDLFAKYEVENIVEYRQKTNATLPSLFLIIDEFADLLDFYPFKERDEITMILKRYGQMARAAGVHLVLITQRATSQNIPGEVRANLGARLSFRVNTSGDSQFILEEDGAEKIEKSGIGLLKKNHLAVEKLYIPLIQNSDIENIVSKNINKYPEHKHILVT